MSISNLICTSEIDSHNNLCGKPAHFKHHDHLKQRYACMDHACKGCEVLLLPEDNLVENIANLLREHGFTVTKNPTKKPGA